MSETLEFSPICLKDREWINKMLLEEQPEACEYTFANNFIWRGAYEVEVGQVCGCGIVRYQDKKGYRFSFPFGKGDKKAVIEILKSYCREKMRPGYRLDFYPITDKHRRELIEWFPGQYVIDADRDDFDYIYLTEDLASLKGKRYHGKRNHIARFQDDDDWSYEPLNEENLEECRRMEKEWVAIREDKWEEGVDEETTALREALDHYGELGLIGGLIRKAGKVVAFTIGEPMSDQMMVVHFEKAYPDLQGAYPMINQQFVLHECQKYKYVNREEDVGDPGLRKAKLSYYPEILLRKYNAVESGVVYANENDVRQILRIWRVCFGDEENYIRFYLAHRFETENMLVIHRDGSPVSMASFLPAMLRQGEEWIPARYVYAVATLPEYRGKGLASEILRYASEKYREPLILQAADASLQTFYERLGFVDAFEREEWEIEAQNGAIGGGFSVQGEQRAATGGETLVQGELKAVSGEETLVQGELRAASEEERLSREISLAEYKEIRDAHFDRENYVSWDEDAIAYALLENDFCGGHVLKVGQQILLYRIEDNALRVVETSLTGRELQACIQELLARHQLPRAIYQNRGGMIKYPRDEKGAPENPACGYLNLTLG